MATLISGYDRVRLLTHHPKTLYITAEVAVASGDIFESRVFAEQTLANLDRREEDPNEARVCAVLLSFLAKDSNTEILLATIAETGFKEFSCIPNTVTGNWLVIRLADNRQ